MGAPWEKKDSSTTKQQSNQMNLFIVDSFDGVAWWAEWMVAFLWFPWLVCSQSGLWAQQRQLLRTREDKRQERNQREGIIHEAIGL